MAENGNTEDVRELLNDLTMIKEKKIVEAHQKDLDSLNKLQVPVSAKAPFVISFVGKFKTGKSSLINALLGMDLLPTRATTATAVVTRIFKGKKFRAWVTENGGKRSVTPEYAQNVILNYQVKDAGHPAEIIFEVPVPWLREDIELRDTPGMDDSSQEGMLETVALNALNDTDLCVCVYDAGAMISGAEKERTWKIHKQLGGNAVYAVNCTNRLNSTERVNEVDKLCRNFFGSMEPQLKSVPGLGKYYMMCSAPKMIELDGFDGWLKELVSAESIMARQNIREVTVSAQIADKRAEISGNAKSEIEDLQILRKKLCCIQNEEKKSKVKAAKEDGKKQSEKIKNIAAEAEKILVNTDDLRSKLTPLASGENWKNEYSSKTKESVRQHFEKNFADIRKKWKSYFVAGDKSFVRNVTEATNFPGSHVKYVSATTGEKWGWAGAGAGIGALLGGPIGAIIGGTIGRAIGGNDSTIDDSVDNTMSFVQSNIIPQIKVSFESLVSKAAERVRKRIVEEADKAATGYEEYITEVDHLLDDLKRFVME